MSITLQLTSEIESLLLAEAGRTSSDASALAQELLLKSLQKPDVACLTAEEDDLVRAINIGLPVAAMNRYEALIKKRQSEQLSEAEREELSRITDAMESLMVGRLQVIAKLAKSRGIGVEEMVAALEIYLPDVL
jgi:hypothetical protein